MPNLPDAARRLLARLHDGEPVRTRPLNRREVEALHRALREQTEVCDLAGDDAVDIECYRLRLAPLVEAVLAAQSESFVAERERSIRAGARRANKRFKL